MNKLYDRIDWVNNTTPALNQTNLNKMSKALDDIDDRIIDIAGDMVQAVADCNTAATNAENSATAAAASASAASGSAQTADDKAHEASSHEYFAGQYAEAASNSASAADRSARDALDYKVAAGAFKEGAQVYAEQAQDYAIGNNNYSAAYFADQAQQYATGSNNYSAAHFADESHYYADQAATSASIASQSVTHPPYIGANGDWFIWDTNTQAFIDSNVDASITVTIADITMLSPTAAPYVTNTGTSTDPIFHLFIPEGVGIQSVTKTGSSGLVDTYTITFTDADTTTFTVTNGKSAYQYATDGGYTGTEAQFETDLGNFQSYASTASTSASSASSSASSASSDALKAEGYAVGEQNGTPVTTGSPYYENNAKYWSDLAAQYAQSFSGLVFKGSIAYASIPTTGQTNGDMYDINEAFVTDSRFEEGAGVACPAGTDIVWVTDDNKWNILTPAGVYSFNGRQGAVSPASGDYDASEITYNTNSDVDTALGNKLNKPTVKTQTLSAGSTSVTFTQIPTSGDYMIDFFTSTGINYTGINTATAGQVTLTFEAQSGAVTVYCRIEEVS